MFSVNRCDGIIMTKGQIYLNNERYHHLDWISGISDVNVRELSGLVGEFKAVTKFGYRGLWIAAGRLGLIPPLKPANFCP